MTFTIEVNGQNVKAQRGETILQVLQRNGIRVPTLCYMKDFFPSGSCRMCVVEVEGYENLVTACSQLVEEWMKITTNSQRVMRARKTLMELLLANHPDDCLYCERNLSCEIQRLAEETGVREHRFFSKKKVVKKDLSGPGIIREPSKCILCGRCVRICSEVQSTSALDFTHRGCKTIVTPALNKGINTSNCTQCGQCLTVCPTAALSEKKHIQQVIDALYSKSKQVMTIFDPLATISLADAFGMKPGLEFTGKLIAAFKKMGFSKVFDASVAFDIYCLENAARLVEIKKNNQKETLITSNCPAWVKYCENKYPNVLPSLSNIKSQQQIYGHFIKNYQAKDLKIPAENIFTVSVSPCTARKSEIIREEMVANGLSEIDACLITREVIQLINLFGIDIQNIEPLSFDNEKNLDSSCQLLSGISGGTAESILRAFNYTINGNETNFEKISPCRNSKKRSEFNLNIGKYSLQVCIVNTLVQAEKLLNEIESGLKHFDLIEIMACPGGCVAGGGQPFLGNEYFVRSRIKTLYDFDEKSLIKIPQKNPEVQQFYKEKMKCEPGISEETFLHWQFNPSNITGIV